MISVPAVISLIRRSYARLSSIKVEPTSKKIQIVCFFIFRSLPGLTDQELPSFPSIRKYADSCLQGFFPMYRQKNFSHCGFRTIREKSLFEAHLQYRQLDYLRKTKFTRQKVPLFSALYQTDTDRACERHNHWKQE